MTRFFSINPWLLGLTVLAAMAGCGDAPQNLQSPSQTRAVASIPTVALPAITLEPAPGAAFCAPSLSVSLYVQGPEVKGALVETLSVAGCAEQSRHTRFYEFRRSLFACGRLTHIGSLAGSPEAKLTLIDRSSAHCEQDVGYSEIEVVEQLPSGQVIKVTGSF